MLFDAFVYSIHDVSNSFIIDCHSSVTNDLKKHLKNYFLRSQLNFENITSQYTIFHSDEASFESWNHLVSFSYKDPRHENFGYRLLVSNKKAENEKTNLLNAFKENYYLFKRFLFGFPEQPFEILKGTSLPFECNIDWMNGIDFQKGCYLGQELTIRTKHTGIVRKRIFPLIICKQVPNETTNEPLINSSDLNESFVPFASTTFSTLLSPCQNVALEWSFEENYDSDRLNKSQTSSSNESNETIKDRSIKTTESLHLSNPSEQSDFHPANSKTQSNTGIQFKTSLSGTPMSNSNKILSTYGNFAMALLRIEELHSIRPFDHYHKCNINGDVFYAKILTTSVAYQNIFEPKKKE